MAVGIDIRHTSKCAAREGGACGCVARADQHVPVRKVATLSPEQMDLAEAAILKLYRSRYPGRPVTVRRADGDPIHEAGPVTRAPGDLRGRGGDLPS